MHVPSDIIAFAQELAQAARQETLPRWVEACDAQSKGSGAFDPVTDADREAERAMRGLIRERYPDHGVTGEELADELGSGRYRWSLDPVDGTRSFICRLPTWVTLIGLLHDDKPIFGMVDAPCLNETYVGYGDGAWMSWNGARKSIRTSGCARLSEARLSSTDPFLFEASSAQAFDRLRQAVQTTRYGHDGYAYARLAGGSIDLVVECGLKPHDYDALIPLVRAAGGMIGDWKGSEDFSRGKLIAAATSELYREAVGYFESLE